MTRRRLPALSADDVVRALERAGFRVHRIKGSHHHLRKPDDLRPDPLFPCTGAICRRARCGRSSSRLAFSVREFLDFL
jgi:hypothetical protein